MVRKEVLGYYPKLVDAQYEMGPHFPFIGLKNESKGEHFLPTDVVLGLDGAIYFSDFYNDTSPDESDQRHDLSGFAQG